MQTPLDIFHNLRTHSLVHSYGLTHAQIIRIAQRKIKTREGLCIKEHEKELNTKVS